MKPLDRVRTATGQEGLVRSVDAWPMVEVLFAEGSETLHRDDLQDGLKDRPNCGRPSSAEPWPPACRFTALTLNSRAAGGSRRKGALLVAQARQHVLTTQRVSRGDAKCEPGRSGTEV